MVATKKRTADIIRDEAEALERLIKARNEWLQNDSNKSMPTYEAVKRDTLELSWQHNELTVELQSLKTKI
ncbi:MAG: hypothetical protein JW783_00480 [Bacteroidales bacterium]|nr:hypothetical protein [Bacteroidales bacterium]MBN2748497.1 hypothetical protein [Bacteroidales bacterium]